MSLKSIFFPENKKFFLLFDELATNLGEMSRIFLSTATDDTDKLSLHVTEIEELEKATEVVTHKLLVETGRNFITPFDREDILLLGKGLSGIAARLLAVTRQLRNYEINDTQNLTRIVAREYHKAIDMLTGVLRGLRNTKSLIRLADTCAEIKSVLYDCENLLDRSISGLTEQQSSTVDVIKKMDHYEALQKLSDTTSDTINVIESIIIKYG